MPHKLSKEEMKEVEECFSVFSKDGKLSVSDVGLAVRSLGYSPSNAELEKIVRDLNIKSDSINFQVFTEIFNKDLPSSNTAEEIREAFGIFDKDNQGSISVHELKHLLTSTGERLTEDEVDVMLRDADVDSDGFVQYEQFVDAMARK